MTVSPHPNARHITHSCARDAIACLSQGVDLLNGLTDEQYVTTLPPVFVSGLGAHVRHILDHVDCLLAGMDNGDVDYDGRRREARAERDRGYAIEQLRHRMQRLTSLSESDGDVPLKVNMDTGCGTTHWAHSTLTRELQFVISHTIHHYALMAAILGHAGLPVPTDFGISPSTLRHRDAQQGR